MNYTVAGLALATLARSCAIHVAPVTGPPPTRTAELVEDDQRIRVSRGIAFALECTNARDSTPCEALEVTVDDDSIAGVSHAYVHAGGTAVAGSAQGTGRQRAVFVVEGRAVGETLLTLRSADGEESFEVQVTLP